MSRSRELVKQVLEIPRRIEVEKPAQIWKNLFGVCAHQRSQTLRKGHLYKNSEPQLFFRSFVAFYPRIICPPPSHIPKDRPSHEKPHHFKEPPRPPPLKRLKKRRHQKVKSHGELRYQLDPQAPANFQIVGPRSVPEFWKAPKKGRGVGVGEKISVAEIVDKLMGELGQHWQLWIRILSNFWWFWSYI